MLVKVYSHITALNLPETIEALTEIMYAMAKKVARPALNSVKNLDPFLSFLCPENSNLNRLPTILLATAMLVFSICEIVSSCPQMQVASEEAIASRKHTHPMMSKYVLV